MRCAYQGFFRSVGIQTSVAEVIGQDENDVGTGWYFLCVQRSKERAKCEYAGHDWFY